MTTDNATTLLLQSLSHQAGKKLLFADENTPDSFSQIKNQNPDCHILTNRFDLFKRAEHAGLHCLFNDWMLDTEQKYDAIALRICKEKQVNNHLISLAQHHLNKNGTFLLCGEKNEGIKTLGKSTESLFQIKNGLKKHGTVYLGSYSNPNAIQPTENTYHEISTIGSVNDIALHSKPGVYGWNKIDAGSAFLVEEFKHYISQQAKFNFSSLLDLGCGYGYLTFATAELPFAKRVATDNNYAAILCCKQSAEQASINLTVIPSDCAGELDKNEKFSCILCNPPFHKGFDVQNDLTSRFLTAAHSRLLENGLAFFVVNSFIGIEKKAAQIFGQHKTIANNGQFKIIVAQK